MMEKAPEEGVDNRNRPQLPPPVDPPCGRTSGLPRVRGMEEEQPRNATPHYNVQRARPEHAAWDSFYTALPNDEDTATRPLVACMRIRSGVRERRGGSRDRPGK